MAQSELFQMREQRDALADALRAMLQDYRSEGCPDPNCRVCERSKRAEKLARDALKGVDDAH